MLLKIEKNGDMCKMVSDNAEITSMIKDGVQAIVYSVKCDTRTAHCMLSTETELSLTNGNYSLAEAIEEMSVKDILNAIDISIKNVISLHNIDDEVFDEDDFDSFDEY
jgi:hypothetical protein